MQNKISEIKNLIKHEESNKRELEDELARSRGRISALKQCLEILEQSTEEEVKEDLKKSL